MKRLFATCIYLLVLASLGAQGNLVANGDFETYTQCPGNSGGDIAYASPWYDPTGTTSDYYNACNNMGYNVPNAGGGFQFARSGVAFAGFFTYGWFNQREYIQAPLNDSLVAGVRYRVSFYVNLFDNFDYATNNIGAFLSPLPVNTMGPGEVLSYQPQILNPSTNPLISKTNWMLVSDTFTAAGGEKYITIGNFNDDSNTDTVYVGGGTVQGVISYYYIDDVSVYPDSLTGIQFNSTPDFNITLFPNPASGSFTVKTTIGKDQQGIFLLHDLLGQEVLSHDLIGGNNNFPVATAELPNGIYTWTEVIDGVIVGDGKIVINR